MSLELGVYTFGNTPRTADGAHASTAQAVRDALEAVHLAEEVGLDFFGFGEHHLPSISIELLGTQVLPQIRAGLGQ